jgi:hypothetical protein
MQVPVRVRRSARSGSPCLDLAARLEGLLLLDPSAVVDADRLKRWQNVHADDVTRALRNRDALSNTPVIVSEADLRLWITQACQALTVIMPRF